MKPILIVYKSVILFTLLPGICDSEFMENPEIMEYSEDESREHIIVPEGDPISTTTSFTTTPVPEDIIDLTQLGTARILGLGYHLFQGNPFSHTLDPGLTFGDSFKPVSRLAFSCNPDVLDCAHDEEKQILTRHPPQITTKKFYVKNFSDYQKAILERINVAGKSTSNLTEAIGLSRETTSEIRKHLADGSFFIETVQFSVAEEAKLKDDISVKQLQPALVHALCDLPNDYDRNQADFISLIRNFGTHVVIKVQEGTISVNRTVIDANMIRTVFQQTSQEMNQKNSEGLTGFFVQNITNSVLNQASQLRGATFKTFTSTEKLPIVTALRELSHFITADLLLENFENVCPEKDLAEEGPKYFETLQRNIRRALVDYAKEIKKNDDSIAQPPFIPWPQPPTDTPTTTVVPITITPPARYSQHKCSSQLLSDAQTYLGLGYDLFRADPQGNQADPGFHSSTPILIKTQCQNSATGCSEEMTCVTMTDADMRKVEHHVSQKNDYVLLELDNSLRIIDKLPDNVTLQRSGASASMNKVNQLLSTSVTFTDQLTINTLAEAALEYRRMEKLNSAMLHALCELPEVYNEAPFISFLKEFGTHVVVKVRMGNITVHRTENSVTEPRLEQSTKQTSISQSVFGAHQYQLVSKTLVPVMLTLRELSHLITSSRIQHSISNVPSCQFLLNHNSSLSTLRRHLARALVDYASEVRNLYLPNERPPTPQSTLATTPRPATPLVTQPATPTTSLPDQPSIPVDPIVPKEPPSFNMGSVAWPAGNYGLLEASAGCPNGVWHNGERFQDSEDLRNKNAWHDGFAEKTTSIFNREGIRFKFCVKTTPFQLDEPEWPEGHYCLFKKGQCPAGFSVSHVDHDDEDHRNGNTASGMLPDGFYTADTRYYFCCRADGNPSDPIVLPTEKPFFLLRQGAECQSVLGMNATPFWLYTDCEDTFPGCRISPNDVAHPGFTTVHGDWQWHFCYYYHLEASQIPIFFNRFSGIGSDWDLHLDFDF